METAIRLDRVSKHYGATRALDAVSLEVPSGVVFALLGENGAGKTTAIRILLGLLEADGGRAEVLGLDSARQGLEIRRRVGYVSERPTMYDWMRVREIGWFAAGFYPAGFKDRFDVLVAGFQLSPEAKIKTLSKGMRAKVALALAMAHDPALLVLDEPTSGLDTLVRREFLESMVDLAASGRTVLLSSHQIAEVERVADLVAILHAGRILALERVETLKEEVRALTVTLDEESTVLPALPGGMLLSSKRRGRQVELVARGIGDGACATLRAQPGVREVDAYTPSLEEIFVAYLDREKSGAADAPPREARAS